MKGIFRLGLDVFVSTFFTVFINNSLLIFAGMVSTLEASARLAVNLKISQLGTQVLHRIPAAAEPILMELISHRDLGRFRFAWTALAKVTMALALAAAGCIFLWGSRLVAWWTDPGMNVEPAALAWLALLPLRFILHYFLVGTLVMFKEIRRVRTALIFEAALYTLLAWQLGRVAGVAGLLCGCVISLAGGAVWWGVPAVASLAGLRVREVVVLTVRACALPAAAYAVLAIFAPAGPQMAWPRLVGLTGGWLAFNAAHLFAVVLDAGDRAFLGAFRSRMATRLGFSRSA